MTTLELKAYEIGIKEAHKQKCIVPAIKSKAMTALMEEVKNNLLPLIKAYDYGVAYEINRQMKLLYKKYPYANTNIHNEVDEI